MFYEVIQKRGCPKVPIRRRRETRQGRMQARVHPRKEKTVKRQDAAGFLLRVARTGAVETKVLVSGGDGRLGLACQAFANQGGYCGARSRTVRLYFMCFDKLGGDDTSMPMHRRPSHHNLVRRQAKEHEP
jgi:hypothetical protein